MYCMYKKKTFFKSARNQLGTKDETVYHTAKKVTRDADEGCVWVSTRILNYARYIGRRAPSRLSQQSYIIPVHPHHVAARAASQRAFTSINSQSCTLQLRAVLGKKEVLARPAAYIFLRLHFSPLSGPHTHTQPMREILKNNTRTRIAHSLCAKGPVMIKLLQMLHASERTLHTAWGGFRRSPRQTSSVGALQGIATKTFADNSPHWRKNTRRAQFSYNKEKGELIYRGGCGV